ncbi:MAG: GntR family transcriptional regulator [Clostridiales bacterium]|jgi:DNA-binding GntR family transcriptional regulator|nr:GntR family transcriptional regulator [Clostridiales bacterium]
MKIFEPERGESLRMYSLRVLRENIITTEFEPGVMLYEKEIATALNVSRSPVREALAELSQFQLIEILPQRGSRVALIDMDLVNEAVFFRTTMEVAIVKLTCTMASEKDLSDLEEILKLQEFYLQNFSKDKFMELDNQFHYSLFKICNKLQCYNMVSKMGAHFDRIRNLSLHVVKDLKLVQDHRDIFHAIKDRDPKKAEEMIRKHLSRIQLDEKEIRKTYPQYFKN